MKIYQRLKQLKKKTGIFMITDFFDCLWEWSGRIVFKLTDNLVVKFAKNKKWIAQNKTESFISSKITSQYFAKILYTSKNYACVVQERAEPFVDNHNLNEQKFFHYMWEKIDDFLYYLRMKKEYNPKNAFAKLVFNEISIIVNEFYLESYELAALESWWFLNDIPVIIDYWLDLNTLKTLY